MGEKIVTGKVRFSYVHVFEPKAVEGSTEKKYSVSLIIPKSDKKTVRDINAAIERVKQEGIASKWGGKLPKKLKLPLRDGDEEKDGEEYADSWFLNANATRRPGVVDKALHPILDEDEFYSGCYGRASITFFAYNSNGNIGIGCGLNNLQKLADGESLMGVSNPEDDFGEFDDDDDDMLD